MSPDVQELMRVVAPLYERAVTRAAVVEVQLDQLRAENATLRDRVASLLDEATSRGQRVIDVVRLAHAMDRPLGARRAS